MTKFLIDGKTHSAINSKKFKRPKDTTDQLYEFELVKPEVEQREPTIVGFFIMQYVCQRILEFYNIFFKKYCEVD